MVIGPTYIFMQVPRTSSSSITWNLCKKYEGHQVNIHGTFADTGHDEDREGRFVFGFTRNPYEREFSEWRYHASKKDDVFQPITFEQWVLWRYSDLTLPEEWFRPKAYHYLQSFSRYPQLGWFMDEQGDIITDYIGCYENRQVHLDHIYSHLGFPDQTGRFLEASHGPVTTDQYQDHYTNEMTDIITDRYLPDLLAFGYGFEQRETIYMQPEPHLVSEKDFRLLENTQYLNK